MDVEVRRNTDITFTITGDFSPQEDLVKELWGELTEEQKNLMEDADRRWKRFCEMFWKAAREQEFTDLDGNPILESTHELGYDLGEPDEDGFCTVEHVWVRPIKAASWGVSAEEVEKYEEK